MTTLLIVDDQMEHRLPIIRYHDRAIACLGALVLSDAPGFGDLADAPTLTLTLPLTLTPHSLLLTLTLTLTRTRPRTLTPTPTPTPTPITPALL